MSDKSRIEQSSSVIEPKDFRDRVGTMDSTGNRNWIYPKKPKGKFTNYRTYVSWVLLTILFITPFIKLPNGNPLLQFNVLAREFYIFGNLITFDDGYILVISMITSLVFIILFTVVYGRIFCGWVCPQTIFLEMVFRKIEFAIEGDRNKQIRLSNQKWDTEKITKKGLKWLVFVILSFIISNIFLSYIIGWDHVIDGKQSGLKQYILEGPFAHVDLFIGLLVFTALFFFVFAWFREQACTLVCPYGRLQGVLIDKKTIVVAYDYRRGEREQGRAKWKKGQDRESEGVGDCIDCGQCVVVCPTGIDIRHGTQLECVNCTACIDACDEVMEKVGLPTQLIRYASEENISEGTKWKFNTRVLAYTAVLAILLGVLTSMIFIRPAVKFDYTRFRSSNFIEMEDTIHNPYLFTIKNKTDEEEVVKIVVIQPEYAELYEFQEEGKNKVNTYVLDKEEVVKGQFIVKIPKSKLKTAKEFITIGIQNEEGEIIDSEKSTFSAPTKTLY